MVQAVILFCDSCGLKLPTPRTTVCMVGTKNVCHACFEMYNAAYNNPWMRAAHVEYIDEMKQKKRLRPGGDYFS